MHKGEIMEITNPGQILQIHGIEVSPEDQRTSAQILAHYVEIGHIVLPSELKIGYNQNNE